ncbi:hypothetical protein HK098_006769 [Nowakowskiella sp. JEL0407]|nr:hypothetical protein HK098_006769 [Nowakowskiella sp. JEL0407]
MESFLLPYRILASKKNIELSFHIADDVATFVLGDICRLKQVFHNLIGNAMKFTNAGSISVLSPREDWAEICMSVNLKFQHGDIKEIFEPFSQNDISQKNKGTGLGLAISKAIIEQMNGKIWCESRHECTEECEDACCGRTRKSDAPLKSKKIRLLGKKIELDSEEKKVPLNILIADDNEVNVMIGLKVLDKLGFKADVAINGLEAVEAVSNKNYDLVLMVT